MPDNESQPIHSTQQLSGSALSDEEQASHDALRAEYDKVEETYAEAEELPASSLRQLPPRRLSQLGAASPVLPRD
jgi:hypothetical protein